MLPWIFEKGYMFKRKIMLRAVGKLKKECNYSYLLFLLKHQIRQTYFLKAAEIPALSSDFASSFEKKPKPENDAVCPDFDELSSAGGDVLPMVFHRVALPPDPLPSAVEEEAASSFLSSPPARLGLVS